MSAIGLPNGKDFVLSAYADYRRDAMMFARQQSPAMRELEWESRVRPLKSWASLLAPWLAGFLTAILLLTCLR
ncbi:MAG TPA: hypothetical protein VN723_10625 [Rhizomicrobium sp.]|jgi:hypothetical protein|nr:hypothetical protein [Rhizomicrobium sp.]